MRNKTKGRGKNRSVSIPAMNSRQSESGGNDEVSEIEDAFRDFIEENKQSFKATSPLKATSGKQFGLPEQMPTRFEDASICVDCRHYMEMQTYSDVVVDDPTVPGGRRNMLVTMRRCLIGAIKLPSGDDPRTGGMMKGLGVQAPIAYKCNRFSPYSDDEIEERDVRLAQFEERKRQRQEDQIALENAQRQREVERTSHGHDNNQENTENGK